MSYNLTPPFIICCILYLILCPSESLSCVKGTLLLWYQSVLPTLFPALLFVFILLSMIKFKKGAHLFCALTGLFCGFPVGCTVACQLVQSGHLSKEKGSLYTVLFNQFSPVFLSTYVAKTTLHTSPLPVFLLLYGSLLPLAVINLLRSPGKTAVSTFFVNNEESTQQILLAKTVEDSILQASETLVKIGGYMILCSLLGTMSYSISKNPILRIILAPILETTSGIGVLAQCSLPHYVKKALILGSVNFGGICGILQVSTHLSCSNLSIRNYLGMRLFTALCCIALSMVYFSFV